MNSNNWKGKKNENYWHTYWEQRAKNEHLKNYSRVGYSTSSSANAMYGIVKKLIGNPRDCLILDAGCGDGQLTSCFVSENRVIGVDFSSSMLAGASKRGLRTKCEDLSSLSFEDSSVDWVVCVEVLTQAFEPELILRELCRVLRPGGELVVTGQNDTSLLRCLLTPFFERLLGLPQPKLLNVNQFQVELEKAGLEILSLSWIFAGIPWKLSGKQWFSNELYSRIGTNFILHARRLEI